MKKYQWLIVLVIFLLLVSAAFFVFKKNYSSRFFKTKKECNFFIFAGEEIGCDFVKDLELATKMVVRLKGITAKNKNVFIRLERKVNGEWLREEFYVGNEASGDMVSLGHHKTRNLSPTSEEIEVSTLSVSEFKEAFKSLNLKNKEAVIFLQKIPVNIEEKDYYRVSTINFGLNIEN